MRLCTRPRQGTRAPSKWGRPGAVVGHKRLHVALRRSLSHCIPGLSSLDPVLDALLLPVLECALTNVQAAERFISPKLGSLFGARSVTGLTDALRVCRPSGEKSQANAHTTMPIILFICTTRRSAGVSEGCKLTAFHGRCDRKDGGLGLPVPVDPMPPSASRHWEQPTQESNVRASEPFQ